MTTSWETTQPTAMLLAIPWGLATKLLVMRNWKSAKKNKNGGRREGLCGQQAIGAENS